jgi:SWIM zinc finger
MKTTSPVTILTRVSFKSDARKVVYQALSSDGATKYNVFLFAGKASSCECPSRKPCRHMKAAESREAERQAQAAVEDDFSDLIEPDYNDEIAAAMARLRSQAQVPPKYAVAPRVAEDWSERSQLNGSRAFSILR